VMVFQWQHSLWLQWLLLDLSELCKGLAFHSIGQTSYQLSCLIASIFPA